jgi:putrescine aminotransferase
LARLHTGKKEIITARNSFHGFTFGALSASGIPSVKRFFEPMVPDFVHVPFGDIEALKKSISENTAAIMLEPIQHEAGVALPPEGYFQEVRHLCEKRGIILILDEIKTGMGKTGRMFASEHFGIVPDILVLGKSLGGGLIPIGAVVAKKGLWYKFGLSFAMSASSFAGNGLACVAALTTIHILQKGNLFDECKDKGQFLLLELNKLMERYPMILRNVKGLGLLLGIETTQPQKALLLSKEMISRGVLTVTAFGNSSVLMIEPPLVISFDQLRKVLKSLQIACERLSQIN